MLFLPYYKLQRLRGFLSSSKRGRMLVTRFWLSHIKFLQVLYTQKIKDLMDWKLVQVIENRVKNEAFRFNDRKLDQNNDRKPIVFESTIGNWSRSEQRSKQRLESDQKQTDFSFYRYVTIDLKYSSSFHSQTFLKKCEAYFLYK